MTIKSAPWSWIVVALMLSIAAKGPYRVFIRENALNDFGISNVLPGFLFIMFISFAASRWTTQPAAFAGLLAAGIGTEILQLDKPGRTFDWWDLVAVFAGWCVAIALLRFHGKSKSMVAENAAEQRIPADRAKARSD